MALPGYSYSKKKLVVILSIIALSLTIVIPGYKNVAEDPIDEIIQDDIEKNKILHSSSTDYSNPDEKERYYIIEHVVKPGENLSGIAQEYGVSVDTIVSLEKILTENNLSIPDFVGG